MYRTAVILISCVENRWAAAPSEDSSGRPCSLGNRDIKDVLPAIFDDLEASPRQLAAAFPSDRSNLYSPLRLLRCLYKKVAGPPVCWHAAIERLRKEAPGGSGARQGESFPLSHQLNSRLGLLIPHDMTGAYTMPQPLVGCDGSRAFIDTCDLPSEKRQTGSPIRRMPSARLQRSISRCPRAGADRRGAGSAGHDTAQPRPLAPRRLPAPPQVAGRHAQSRKAASSQRRPARHHAGHRNHDRTARPADRRARPSDRRFYHRGSGPR